MALLAGAPRFHYLCGLPGRGLLVSLFIPHSCSPLVASLTNVNADFI